MLHVAVGDDGGAMRESHNRQSLRISHNPEHIPYNNQTSQTEINTNTHTQKDNDKKKEKRQASSDRIVWMNNSTDIEYYNLSFFAFQLTESTANRHIHPYTKAKKNQSQVMLKGFCPILVSQLWIIFSFSSCFLSIFPTTNIFSHHNLISIPLHTDNKNSSHFH